MTKESVLIFIKSKKHAVISTSGFSNIPEAALIGFGESDSFELVFGTSSSSRKYKNLQENKRVALVIGWDDNRITVQYKGVASEIFGEELERYVAEYHKKVPTAVSYMSQPG